MMPPDSTLCRLSKAVCAGVGSVSGYRGLVGPSKPGSELASRHVRSIATGLGNTETKLPIPTLLSPDGVTFTINIHYIKLSSTIYPA